MSVGLNASPRLVISMFQTVSISSPTISSVSEQLNELMFPACAHIDNAFCAVVVSPAQHVEYVAPHFPPFSPS